MNSQTVTNLIGSLIPNWKESKDGMETNPMRKRGRVDVGQAGIVYVLRRVGASVTSLSNVGGGCPDLLVGFRGRTYALEVKSPKGKRTDAQILWWADFKGAGGVVHSETEALKAIGAIP